MVEIQFFEEVFGGDAGRRPLRTLRLDHETISVGDLIRFRVVARHAEPPPEPPGSPAWLKAHAARAEPVRLPPLEQAIADARRGLLTNAYFLVVNGRQLRDLDEKVALNDVNEAIFFELIPLKGG